MYAKARTIVSITNVFTTLHEKIIIINFFITSG